MQQVKMHVKIAYDVKRNQIVQVLSDFEKRYLRLKIVQHQKRVTPQHLLQMDGNNMRFDLDQLSMSGASAMSESQFSQSSMGGVSETSKKSKRQGALKKKQQQKLRKKRQVKEGSPYEEAFLLAALREEVRVTPADRDEVRDIMRACLNFGMVKESTDLHEHLERLIKAEHSVQGLYSLEQQQALTPTLLELFPEQLGRREEAQQKALAEWRDVKFFKH